MATFSLVASAWKSNTMTLALILESRSVAALKGSLVPLMKTLPIRLSTAYGRPLLGPSAMLPS